MAVSPAGRRRRAPRPRRSSPGSANMRMGRRWRRKAHPVSSKVVIPAKAGIPGQEGSVGLDETPAFAGVTGCYPSGRPPYPRFGEPGPCLALRNCDLAGGHLLGNLGPAFLAPAAAVEGGEIEPFV